MLIDKRHGDHHFINVKWGYILLFISLIYYAFLIYLNIRNFNRLYSKSSMKHVPLIIHGIIWSIILIATFISLLHEFNWGAFLKRFGRFSYVLVTLDILLVIRPNFINYIYLITTHKWISRLILFLGSIHSVGFLVRWVLQGVFLTKFFKWENSLGFAIFLAFSILAVFSLKPFRRINYVLFYLIHNVTLILFIGLIDFHARPGVDYLTIINVICLIFQIMSKFNVNKAVVHDLKTFGDLTVLSFEMPENFPLTLPGSHLRLSVMNWSNYFLPSHPFTFIQRSSSNNDVSPTSANASMSENEDTKGTLDLVINNRHRFKPSLSPYLVSYPYNSKLSLKSYDQVLLVVGGSGVGYAISILNYYRQFPEFDLTKIKTIWVTRNKKDLGILDYFRLGDDWDIYVTNSPNYTTSQEGEESRADEVEMELLTNEDNVRPFKDGRPLLTSYQGDLLICCGPETLIDECGKLAKDRSISFVHEFYGF
ncbi:probable metalloreductase Aim14p [[Candida] jaroonii]|uniref:Probable metalloreductase Aim14p n=1 Tax=[Candida] jaroonii TaxID=467808 RepID=A0ACA9YGE7_9ASCO|nr:probable metalloreductase Aim14p [[Candida] jaroonii]